MDILICILIGFAVFWFILIMVNIIFAVLEYHKVGKYLESISKK